MPLVDVEDSEKQIQDGNDPSNQSKLEQFKQNLHFSKLLSPENDKEIPENRLKQEILQLQQLRIAPPTFKILDPEDNDISIEVFIEQYERGNGDGYTLILIDFVKPRRFDGSKCKKFNV